MTGHLDVAGTVLVSAGLAGVVYALTEGPTLGWTAPATTVTLVGGILLLGAFLVVERRRPNPILPLELFQSAQFSGANAVTFVVYGGLGGALFLLPVQLQQVLGYSPLAAGLSLLPVTILMLALSARSGALAARIGPRFQLTVGPLFVGAGLALMTRIGAGGDYVDQVFPAVLVLGFGLAVTVAPLTAAVLAAAPAEHSGVASAVNNDVARTASLIAVAVLPVIAGITGSSYLHPAVFSSGFHDAALVAGGACVVGGILGWITVRNPDRAAAEIPPQRNWACALDAPTLSGRVVSGDGLARGSG